jgi:hypothetical protein
MPPTKRSFKAAKKAFHDKAAEKPKKKPEEQRKGPKKPRGVLGYLVDDEEEIEKQKQSENQEPIKKWFDDVPVFEKIDHSRLPVSQIEELYTTAMNEYQVRLEAFQNSTSNTFEAEVCRIVCFINHYRCYAEVQRVIKSPPCLYSS